MTTPHVGQSASFLDVDRLRREIQGTRAVISRTVERYPIPVLVAVAFLGVAVGRRLAISGRAHRDNGRQWPPGAPGPDLAAWPPARPEPTGPPGDDRLAAITASWQRLGSRVEGLVNRVIDDAANVAKRVLVPTLVGGIRAFFERVAARGPAYGPAPPDRTPASTEGKGGST